MKGRENRKDGERGAILDSNFKTKEQIDFDYEQQLKTRSFRI